MVVSPPLAVHDRIDSLLIGPRIARLWVGIVGVLIHSERFGVFQDHVWPVEHMPVAGEWWLHEILSIVALEHPLFNIAQSLDRWGAHQYLHRVGVIVGAFECQRDRVALLRKAHRVNLIHIDGSRLDLPECWRWVRSNHGHAPSEKALAIHRWALACRHYQSAEYVRRVKGRHELFLCELPRCVLGRIDD